MPHHGLRPSVKTAVESCCLERKLENHWLGLFCCDGGTPRNGPEALGPGGGQSAMGDMGALGEPVTQGRPECPECPHPGTSGVAPSLAGVGVPWDPQSEGDPDPAPRRGTARRCLFSGKGWSSPRGCVRIASLWHPVNTAFVHQTAPLPWSVPHPHPGQCPPPRSVPSSWSVPSPCLKHLFLFIRTCRTTVGFVWFNFLYSPKDKFAVSEKQNPLKCSF